MRGPWNPSAVWGGRGRFSDSFRGWLGRFSSVTHFIIWVTTLFFVAQLVAGFFRWDGLQWFFGLSWERLTHGFLWQPITYMLLHGGIWHILINLLFLWMFGREVEYFIGPKPFAKLYLFAGLLGGALWLAFNFGGDGPVLLGASAGVLGCIVAFATLFPNREITFLVFFILPVTMKAKYIAWIAVAFDVVPLLTHAQTNVAHLAHLGGALVGYLYIKQLGYGTMPGWLAAVNQVIAQFRPAPKPRATGAQPDAPSSRRISAEEYIRTKIDPILDKISREGMHSLTKEERKILESARELMQKQQR